MNVLKVKSNGQWVGIPSIRGEKGDTGDTGATGQNGADGVSPSVSVSEITGGHKISVTDASGTSEFNVMDGVDGQDGAPGQDGQNGQNGQDGYSPTVQVVDITGGHRVTITDANGTHVFDVMDGDPTTIINDNAGDGDTAETWSADKEEAVKKALEGSKAPIIAESASGDFIIINDGIGGFAVNQLETSFSPVMGGEGIPSPSNVRSITGFVDMNVCRTGANFCGSSWKIGRINGSTGIEYYDADYYCTSDYFPIKGGKSYYVVDSSSYIRVYFYDQNKTFIYAEITSATKIVVAPENAQYAKAVVEKNATPNPSATYSFNYPYIDTEYHAYVGETRNVSWQTEVGTVYGGKFDALTGILTIGWGIVDLGTLDWEEINTSGGVHYFQTTNAISGIKTISSTSVLPTFVCDSYKTVTGASIYSGASSAYCIGQNDSSTQPKLRITKDEYETASALQTALYGVMLAYELNTPYTVQLDSINALTLRNGKNMLFASGKNINTVYLADTKKYVDAGARDVQINGTSILENGVADIPVANSANYGVAKVSGGNRGIEMDNGFLQITYASSGYIKGGSDARKPIVPYTQHEAVFYGLAKLAGVDLASSNTPIGTFTEQAMLAIQKMLGVSQKWELIRSLTTTEDLAQVTIDTDDYGNAFELSKMMIIFQCGASTTGNMDSFYCQAVGENNSTGTSHTFSTPSLQYVTATSNMCSRIEIDTNKGAPVVIRAIVAVGDGNTQNMQSMVKTLIVDSVKSFKVYQSASDKSLIPSGATFYVYGIRL